MIQGNEKQAERKKVSTASWLLERQGIVELLYDSRSEATTFAVHQDGQISLRRSIVLPSGDELVPVSAKNNLIKHQVVLLPEKPEDFESVEDLVRAIQAYIARYVDFSEEFLGIASYYVLLTWVYDAFNELPYLRVRGDFGCGKTRALLILGSICYKPFFASGASTVSPIFHTIDAFRGTLIFDEADFRFSDEKAELVKIFNNGNVRGFPVLRTSMTAKREFDPVAFTVYGPKIVGMRDAFQDAALESRFITEEMGQRIVRKDIPINLPDRQKDEALALRNQLLMYRFRTLFSTKIDSALANPLLSHRLNQILIPLLSIISDKVVQRDILKAATSFERNLTVERGASPEAQLLEVLARCLLRATADSVSVSEITRLFVAQFGSDYERPITHRYVGSLLRRRLRVFTYKQHGTYAVPISEREKVTVLCQRYGLNVSFEATASAVGGCGDMGTTDGVAAVT